MMILVTGGAGYIGSHVVKELCKSKHQVVVYDSLERGHQESLPKDVVLVNGNLGNKTLLNKTFSKYKINAVIHLAGYTYVGESVQHPLKYYHNNVMSTIILLEVMLQHNVKTIIFSSSAAVYGTPSELPLKETSLLKPINPYGKTKLIIENMLHDAEIAYKLKYVCLRYFNAAGADPECLIGEDHEPETHLIPIMLKSAMAKTSIDMYGTDYPTRDGTCVRDYVHVTDLATAHILALNYLMNGQPSAAFNLGCGTGFTIKEIISAAQQITGMPIKVRHVARREGDPPCLIAGSENAKAMLGWKPVYSDINTIITHAWRWHKSHLDGYLVGHNSRG